MLVGIGLGETSPVSQPCRCIDDLLNQHRQLLKRTPGGQILLDDDAALFLEDGKVMWAPTADGEVLFGRKVCLEPDCPSTLNNTLLPGWEPPRLPQGRYSAP